MKTGEFVSNYFARTLIIAQRKKIHGEEMASIDTIEKYLKIHDFYVYKSQWFSLFSFFTFLLKLVSWIFF